RRDARLRERAVRLLPRGGGGRMTPDAAAASGGTEAREAHLEPHFADLAKQTHAARLGMWGFLGSELLFFGALFALYAGYRAEYPEEFSEAARHTDLLLGSANTVILITASFLVAL